SGDHLAAFGHALPRGERENVAYSLALGNTAIAMAAILSGLQGARLMRLAGQQALPARRLAHHISWRGPAIGGAGGHRGLYCQYLMDAAIDAMVDEFEILDGQALEAAVLLLGQRYDLAGDMMGVAE